MIQISIRIALQLAKALAIDWSQFESIDDGECYLLPFGCKLCKINRQWSIKYYSPNKSDLNQLVDHFPFLKSDQSNPICVNCNESIALHDANGRCR